MLTIVPAGSYLQANPSTVRHLCRSFATSSSRNPLSLRQGVGIETPHNNTLKADHWWF